MEQQSFHIELLGKEYRGHYITDVKTANECLAALMDKDVLFGVDSETAPFEEYKAYPKAALSPHLSSIRLIQVFDGKNAIVFDRWAIECDTIFIPFLQTKRFIAHNALFDLQFFMKMGVENMNVGCTLQLAKLLVHATRPMDMSLTLEALVENVLKIDAVKKMGNSDWGKSDLTFEQIEYAALDPIFAVLLAEALAPGLEKYKLQRMYNLYKKSLHPVASMQLNGLGIDKAAHEKNIDRWRNEAYHLKNEILEYTGLQKLTPHSLADWLEKNLDEQTKSEWHRTEKGKLKTDAHTFSDFSHVEIAGLYSEYQKKDKLISSFGDTLLRLINPKTKRLHASFNISGARTGRMSCSYPNLQQLPRDEVVRNIFVPGKKGQVFVSADFSQIELRCAAEISRDEEMLNAYRKGIDLHALTASAIGGMRLEKVTKDDRQKAKAFNFGLLFGLGHKKFSHYAKMAYKVEVSEQEAKRSIEIWRELYAGYRQWQYEQSERCEASLRASTVCGKLQRLTKDNFYGTGLNHPVQGTAAEIMMHSLVRFHEIGPHHGFDLVNCVHDEITIQCHKDLAEECKHHLEAGMIQGFLDVFPKGITKGLVEAKIGDSWGAVK